MMTNERLHGLEHKHTNGHDVVLILKDGECMNGIQTIHRLEREAAEREAAEREAIEREAIERGENRKNGGPTCGHDICERLYAIDQQTDPAIKAKILAASEADPVESMALLFVNVLEHSEDDNTDLANAMMEQIVAVNPLAGLAILERIDDILDGSR